MSKETWLKEYYPIEAFEVKKKDALNHSLKKWEGLTKSALKKHGLAELPITIYDGTCALCFHYLDGVRCGKCPLAIIRGGIPCDSPREGESHGGPFGNYLKRRDPRPMLYWLRRAKKRIK